MNTFTLITNGYIQNPGREKVRGNVLVHKGKIVDITEDIPSNAKCIDAQGCIITPGLIDQHIHGGYDCDFNTADVDTIVKFLTQLPKHGITAICPTIMTDTPDNIKTQISNIIQAKAKLPENAAKIIGINLEGPFINPKYKGAHAKELTLTPTVQNYQQIESDEIKIITIAPELDKNLELTNYLKDKGVIISVGHSAAENLHGLKHVTHIFNAMEPLHHRNPGIIREALISDDVYVEVIADHNHLHPDIIKLILRTKPASKVIFISDCLATTPITIKKGDAAINEQGNLIGSLIFLDSVIRKNAGMVDFKDLLMYCSSNPAENLGLKHAGRIEKGMDADIVLWDEATLMVKAAFVNGNCVC
ncbi:MAG: N-acetylglucosamine-6-phosphate deacetylase [Candidatus Melainabacteria bacterium GWF2_37_15]|nr:MAG: N-acetylglucosamine-6-phosphate deacetylase [Candidatus Melainabacteria bacterium GWF2_37_15]